MGDPPVKERKRPSVRDMALKRFQKMGSDYYNNYEEKGVEHASRCLLLQYRKNQKILIDGGIYTAKELDDRVDELQSKLSSGNDGTASMEDLFNRWLNAPSEAVQ